jgi:hypothetical protein
MTARGHLLLLATLLPLGAIASVLVAWSCALWSTVWTTPLWMITSRLSEHDAREVWERNRAPQWPDDLVFEGTRQRSFGLALDSVSSVGTASDLASGEPIEFHWSVAEYRLGWPAAALCCGSNYTPLDDDGAWSNSFQWPAHAPVARHAAGRVIPYGPIWPGLLLDTLFYTAILWLLVRSPFEIRRRIRQVRGRCQKCGYPIGVSPVCSECGGLLTSC